MVKEVIKIRDMSFKYKNEYLFKNFNLSIKQGSFTTIIGMNASGKSTLVKILGGLVPSSGYVNIDGYLLNHLYIKKIRRSLAICFDDADVHFIGETVRDDLAFSLENLEYSKKEIENSIKSIASKFKIEDILDKGPTELTLSQKEVVSIASSLIHNPKIIILDESISRLTPKDRKIVFRNLMELKKDKKLTIILITHDLEDTLLSDRTIVLNKGKIILDGNKEEIYKDDYLEKLGFDLPFIVKLSHNLMLYDLLDKVYFSDREVIDALWD